jgi:hypothetical protein
MLTVFFIVGEGGQAQQSFNFGSDANTARELCPGLVFLYNNSQNPANYSVTLSVGGMVFDHNLEYSRQLSEMTTITFAVDGDTGTTGFYHSNQTGLNPPTSPGDVTHTRPERLGAGRYIISLTYDGTTTEFTLDLTDASWADGGGGLAGFRNILVEPYSSGTQRPTVWISDASPIVHINNIDCGAVPTATGHIDRYWELVRYDSPTYSGYQRDRSGFNINPSYRGPSQSGAFNTSEIPYGVYYARSDVDIEVQGSISVPSGRHWYVTTDPDPINCPIEQTLIGFNAGTGLTIENGGTLTSTGGDSFGVVDWFCYNGTDKGEWVGIAGEPGATVIMSYSTITNAVVGLKLDDTDTYDTEVILIEGSRDYGLHIIDCSPYMTLIEASATGLANGPTRPANVRIEGNSRAEFIAGNFAHAVMLSSTSEYESGHGVLTSSNFRTIFRNCVVNDNEGCGYAVVNAVGPYIRANRVRNNTVGLYVKDGKDWTTLRESKIHNNECFGVRLVGRYATPTRLRGWFPFDPLMDPANPVDVDSIIAFGQHEGLNCIYSNEENLRAEHARYDLGSQYLDGSGTAVLLGHKNSIYDPLPTQGGLSGNSYGGLRENWWNGNRSMVAYNPATMDDIPELQNDEAGCTEMSKSVADKAGSLTRDMLLYRRTRGSMQLAGSTSEERRPPASVLPTTMYLAEPYPNPFNPQTSIAVTLFERQDITLFVTDALGRTVATLANGRYEAGRYSVGFQAGSLPSGMYHVVLRNASSVQTRRLLLTK